MFQNIENFLDGLSPMVANLLIAGTAILTGILLKWILTLVLRGYSRKQKNGFSLFRSFITRAGKALTVFIPLLLLNASLGLMELPPRFFNAFSTLLEILIILSFAAILMGIIRVGEDYVNFFYNVNKPDNIRERKVRTQLQYLRKIAMVVIALLTVCAILLNFEGLRKVGAGLLTGVGVGGIIVGFAAQKSLGNLLAGLQIAFTQPIRIDDVLVVEGEWGRVEEITLTYVVVGIWDQRRLILPINYFIEKPFQNWTRTGSEILGTAFLYLDYTAPIDEIRKAFMKIIEESELWDKRVGVMHVTNLTPETLELRGLISANTSGKAFDLRCIVREKLISFIQENHPYCLPKNRLEINRFPGKVD